MQAIVSWTGLLVAAAIAAPAAETQQPNTGRSVMPKLQAPGVQARPQAPVNRLPGAGDATPAHAATAASATAAPAAPKPFDPAQSGEYTSGPWKYRYEVVERDRAVEGRFGWLLYDDERLPGARANDFYETPWGPLYWVGIAPGPKGDHGWMPQPGEGAKGKLLLSPAQLKPDLVVTRGDAGKTITIEPGKVVALRLAGNPTTGFGWKISKTEGTSLTALSEPRFVRKKDIEHQVGVGGDFVFTYRATGRGPTALTLVYTRPWDSAVPPAETFNVVIDVRPAPPKAN